MAKASDDKHQRGLTLKQRQFFWGALFVSPWIVGLLGLVLYPMGLSLYYSFTNYDLIGPPQYVGFSNYTQMLIDPTFQQALYNTLYLVVVMVPLSLIVSLSYALLLNLPIFGQRLYRTILYLPQMVPVVASALLWLWIFNPEYGLINSVLSWFHIVGPLWLNSMSWSKPSIVLMNLWGVGGAAIIFLAGLRGVSPALVDAAKIDGANLWHRFWHVTIPALSPLILFNAIMGILAAMQYFTQAFVMGGGTSNAGGAIGIGNSLNFAMIYLYEVAFEELRMGYASAMGWVLFLMMLILIGIVVVTSAKWVYYEGWKS